MSSSRALDVVHVAWVGVDRVAAAVLVAVVRLYQLLLSPLVGPVCRYAPSCSSYATRALQVHGACCGSALTLRRLARCHPWATGGWDPVPDRPGVHPVPDHRGDHAGDDAPTPAGQPASEHLPEPARIP